MRFLVNRLEIFKFFFSKIGAIIMNVSSYQNGKSLLLPCAVLYTRCDRSPGSFIKLPKYVTRCNVTGPWERQGSFKIKNTIL